VRSLKPATRRFSLSSILNLGIVPGSPEEVRAFNSAVWRRSWAARAFASELGT
jgi:hypothetical protein